MNRPLSVLLHEPRPLNSKFELSATALAILLRCLSISVSNLNIILTSLLKLPQLFVTRLGPFKLEEFDSQFKTF